MKEIIIKAVVGVLVTAFWSSIVVAIKKLHAQQKAQRDGLQSLLRADIIRCFEKYIDRGYCPIYAREALEIEYDAYHNLGGNGTITHLYEELQSLPTEKHKD